MTKPRVELPGSKRERVEGCKLLGPVDLSEKTHVTVVLRRKNEVLPITRHGVPKRRDEYLRAHGADASDLVTVRKFTEEQGLEARYENAAHRVVELHGTVGNLCRAFGLTMEKARIDGISFRQRTGYITLPEDLVPAVHAVLGLDNRRTAHPHRVKFDAAGTSATTRALSPLDVASSYQFPSKWNGSGQTIAIIELDGGFVQTDIEQYFRSMNLRPPRIQAIFIDEQTNEVNRHLPRHPELNADSQVALDIQIAGAVAPGAQQVIYFAQNTDQSFLKAINAALSATPLPVVICVSWGMEESSFTQQAMRAFESAFQDAANLGIPVCASVGNHVAPESTDPLPVDFPASAPHALACGGTTLSRSDEGITLETVWSSGGKRAGGGVSQFFARPVYQSNVDVPAPAGGSMGGRGVPDVSGNADPETGYRIRIQGMLELVGGTGSVAPLWAGLIARLGQAQGGPVGFLHPLLYQAGISSDAFRKTDEAGGDSVKAGLQHTGSRWNARTGLGSPIGTALFKALGAIPATPKLTPIRPRPEAPPPTRVKAPPPTGVSPTKGVEPQRKSEPLRQPTFKAPSLRPVPVVDLVENPPSQKHLRPPQLPRPPVQIAEAIVRKSSTPPPAISSLHPPLSLSGSIKNGGDAVAIVGLMGLAATAGLVSATGLMAAVALSEKTSNRIR